MRRMDRQDVINAITDNYIDVVINDLTKYNDCELLDAIIRGSGFTQINELSDEQLEVEYKELFKTEIKIVEDLDN